MRKLLFTVMFCLTACVVVSFSFCTAQTPKTNLKTGIDSLSYAYGINVTQGLDQYLTQMGVADENKADFVRGFLEGTKINTKDKKEAARLFGISIAQQVSTQILPNINKDLFGGDESSTLVKNQFIAGFIASTLGKELSISKEEAGVFAETKAKEFRAEAAEKLKVKNLAFLEENKTKEGVVTLPSGLQYKVVTEGTGSKPVAENVVKVDYVGTTIDGKEFDTTKGGEPRTFGLDKVIPGWTEGIQQMSVGSKYIFYIPYDLAYGESGRPGSIDPYATLIFEVDLLEIVNQDEK